MTDGTISTTLPLVHVHLEETVALNDVVVSRLECYRVVLTTLGSVTVYFYSKYIQPTCVSTVRETNKLRETRRYSSSKEQGEEPETAKREK